MGYFLEVFWPGIWQYLITVVLPRIHDIIITAYHDEEILWAAVPVLINLFLIQLYFGRNKEETIGLDTAYANSIVVIFVGAGLIKYMKETYTLQALLVPGTDAFVKALFVGAVLVLAFVLALITLFHAVSQKFAAFITNAVVISFITLFSIVIVHSSVQLDKDALASGIIFFLAFFSFWKIFRLIIPSSAHAEEVLEQRKEKAVERYVEQKAVVTQRLRRAEHKILEKEKNLLQAIKEHLR